MNIRQDYSYLFSGFNKSNSSSNPFYGINLADYASIKNGSYGKALKSYYKEMGSQSSSSGNKNDVTNNKENTVNKTETTVDSSKKQEITKLQKNVDELQSSANKLLQKGSASLFKSEYKEADKEALYTAVSDFVSDYNTMFESGKGSTFSSVAGMSGRMEDLAGDYQAALKGIGISLEKGKMTIDKDSFMNADMDQVKKLFNDTNSLGYFVSRRADSIESAIENVAKKNNIDIEAIKKENPSSNSVNNSTTNKTESTVDTARKQEMTNMKKYADELGNAANALLKTGDSSLFKTEYESEDKDALYKAVSDFVSDFNTVLEKGSASTVKSIVNMAGRMKNTADDHKDMLKEIGISVEDKKLSIDKDSFMNADMNQVKKLFNETDSFGYFVSQRADSIEYAANNEANRNNLYTENGTFNNISAGTLYTGIV
mgnify:CR=1 FL=1